MALIEKKTRLNILGQNMLKSVPGLGVSVLVFSNVPCHPGDTGENLMESYEFFCDLCSITLEIKFN